MLRCNAVLCRQSQFKTNAKMQNWNGASKHAVLLKQKAFRLSKAATEF